MLRSLRAASGLMVVTCALGCIPGGEDAPDAAADPSASNTDAGGWCPPGTLWRPNLSGCVKAGCADVRCGPCEACVDGKCYEALFAAEQPCPSPTCSILTCLPGQKCRDGVGCIDDPCSSCLSTQTCVDSEGCFDKTCGGATCATGAVCVAGNCASAACLGVVCPAGSRCANGRCLATRCDSTQCPDGEACVAGACADVSCSGLICPAGLRCSAAHCVAGVESEADAGVDAGD